MRFVGSGVELYLSDSPGRPVALEPGFVRELEDLTGRLVSRCYQCKKCTSGCPVGYILDRQCHEVIRLVQLGAKDAVLRSEAIWLCASCKTCRERCPNDVDPAAVMDALKVLAVASGTPIARKRVNTFQKAFLKTVEMFGRSHELGSIVLYKAMTPAAATDDLGLGLKMLGRGKLKVMPETVKGRREVKAIFRRAAEKAAELSRQEKAKAKSGPAGRKGGAGR